MNQPLLLLQQAAQSFLHGKGSKPPAADLVTALLDLEKQARQEKPSHQFSDLVGTWRLCFITGTKKAQNRAGIVLGSGFYLFAPIRITISFQSKTAEQGTVNNVVQVGLVTLSVSGPAKFQPKKNLLAFDFTQIQFQILGVPIYKGYIRGGKASEEKFYENSIAKQAFFAFFAIQSDLIAARGRGGGLALWVKSDG
ncbi:MAG: hypothetical protein VKJ02_19670 [Snowella sp.]|nr:hypothetical protein [Snowella sp.]